jgi:Tfp pilus assembly protein PilF
LTKSLYDQAGQAYVEGKNANAIDLLHKALKVDASEPQVLAFLAKLDPTAAANPEERSITDSLAKAQKAETNHDYHEAKNLYSDVLKANPGNKTATDGLTRVEAGLLKDAAKLLEGYIQEGDGKKAKAILAKIEQSFPNDDRIKDWQARIATLSNSDSSTDRKAKADEAYNLGLESYRKDDFASAKKFWEEALQIDPHYIQAQQNLNRLTQEHPGLQ